MAFEVKLPDIGEGVAEGEIVRWLVKPGDAVKEDQPLVEVMTDKASVEIPSPRTGTIESLHAEEGAMVPVGTTLLIAVTGETAVAPVAHAPAPPPRRPQRPCPQWRPPVARASRRRRPYARSRRNGASRWNRSWAAAPAAASPPTT